MTTVQEAGRRGGLALFQKRGKRYFVEIGVKGQAVTRMRYPGMASEWGKKGGRPRKA
jgi:general stress protein YciG